MSTNDYIRGVNDSNSPRFNGRLWQRYYCEHIIHTDHSWDHARYIAVDPALWDNDVEHPLYDRVSMSLPHFQAKLRNATLTDRVRRAERERDPYSRASARRPR